jgi:hypothetical protein
VMERRVSPAPGKIATGEQTEVEQTADDKDGEQTHAE